MELEARAVPLRTLPSELVRILPHHSLRGFAKGLAGSCAFGFQGRVARVTGRAAAAERWVVSVVVVEASVLSPRTLLSLIEVGVADFFVFEKSTTHAHAKRYSFFEFAARSGRKCAAHY